MDGTSVPDYLLGYGRRPFGAGLATGHDPLGLPDADRDAMIELSGAPPHPVPPHERPPNRSAERMELVGLLRSIQGMHRLRLDTHLAYEADATILRVYTLPFVSALLQTDAYTEAVYRDLEHRPEDQIGQLMDIRRGRKEALRQREGLEPLELVAVTHECALRQTVGSPEIMRDQLDELLVRSYEDNVTLYVFPFSAKPAFTMTCMWAYFEYQDPEDLEQDLVQIETPAGFWTIEEPGQVQGEGQSSRSWQLTCTD